MENCSAYETSIYTLDRQLKLPKSQSISVTPFSSCIVVALDEDQLRMKCAITISDYTYRIDIRKHWLTIELINVFSDEWNMSSIIISVAAFRNVKNWKQIEIQIHATNNHSRTLFTLAEGSKQMKQVAKICIVTKMKRIERKRKSKPIFLISFD